MKLRKTQYILFLFATFTPLFLTGCYDAIYQSIRREIVMETPIVNGFINDIVHFTDSDEHEWIYLQNGRLFRKLITDSDGGLTNNASYNRWSEVTLPFTGLSYDYHNQEFDGAYVCSLAADSTHIYILTTTPIYDEESSRNVLKNFRLYTMDDTGTWLPVQKINALLISYDASLFHDNYTMDASIQLFCTNTPQSAHRKAFIRIGGGTPYYMDISAFQAYSNEGLVDYQHCSMFELNGAKDPVVVPAESGTIDEVKNIFAYDVFGENSKLGAGNLTNSCVWYDGEVKFLDFLASSTNESRYIDPTYVYFGDGEILRCYNKNDNKLDTETNAIAVKSTDSEENITTYTVERLTFFEALTGHARDDTSKTNDKYSTYTEGELSILDLCKTEKYTEDPILAVTKTDIGTKKESETYPTERMTILDAIKKGYTKYATIEAPEYDDLKDIVKDFLSNSGKNSAKVPVILKIEQDTSDPKKAVWETKMINTIEALSENYSTYLADIQNIFNDSIGAAGTTEDNIISMAVAKNSILLGTDEEGMWRATLSDTGRPTSFLSTVFATNARDQMPDPYVIRTIFSTDPALPEEQNVFYASVQFCYTEHNASASYKDVGLWAYYYKPDLKGWNKE